MDILTDTNANSQGLTIQAVSRKSEYSVGEPLKIDVLLENMGNQSLLLDHRIDFKVYVDLMITNEANEFVPYPGWDVTVRIVEPQDVTEYIKLLPQYFFGAKDITNDMVALDKPGKYFLHIGYADGGFSLYSRKRLKISPWDGSIEADVIPIEIV